ncbi:hypothetical protein AY599_07065 [Leptolyngbya valderiana BDU 20041]|nr:hypothetical protein AY599_07065 [Leptolyngbya valderiana BDU 20041]
MPSVLTRQFDPPIGLLRAGLLAIFFVSGLAGLIYQSIWAQYLGLLLGHAAYSQVLVLAVFMGGMGLGAAIVARRGERWRSLVRAYAIVELLLGLAALVFHPLFVALHAMTTGAGPDGALSPGLAEPVKWVLGIGLILPQSVLLGMSFPLLAAGLMRQHADSQGRSLGSLYFSNSMGAALGAVLAIFALVPLIGLPGTIQFAGLLNLLVAIAAWVLGSRPPERAPRKPASESSPSRSNRTSLLTLILIATTLSSAASFVYEIGWIRMLSLAFGTTLHAFELMLAAFIGGIALGGLWIRNRADQFGRPLLAAGWLQLAMGLVALLSLGIYAEGAFEWVGLLMEALSRSAQGYALYNLGTALAAVVIMLPAAFFAGALLPLLTSLLLRAGHAERVIGQVYAWNSIGAILGVFAALYLLIPLLGLRDAMIAAAAIDLAIGIALLAAAGASGSLRVPSLAGSLIAALGLGLAVALVDFDPYRLASGVFRTGNDRLASDLNMLYYRDGRTASVATYETFDGSTRFITHNGKVDASLAVVEGTPPTADEPTMVLAGALPFAFGDLGGTAAVIGFGSGLTTHTLLARPDLERVDTIEIEARMIDGARLFGDRVELAYADPRSQLIIDDATTVIANQAARYRLIVSEPSNPWMAGVGGLFADEFYAFAASRLSEDGLFVQWLQLYEIDDALVGSILSALAPHFGDFQAWMANSSDLLIVASPSVLPPGDPASLFDGALGRELRRAGIGSPQQLELRHFADRRWLRALSDALEQAPNSWYYPRLSLEAPRTRFEIRSADRMRELAALQPFARRVLGVGAPLPTEVPVPSHNHFEAERLTAIARDHLAQLRGQTRPADAVPVVELLARRSRDCEWLKIEANRIEWLRLYSAVAEQILPHLAPDQADAVAGKGWFGCEASGRIGESLALAAALVANRHDAILARSEAWMDAVEAGRIEAGLFLSQEAWLAGQAVALARGDYAAWEEFRLAYTGLVRPDEASEFMAEVLASYASLLLEDAYLP